jgi:integrase
MSRPRKLASGRWQIRWFDGAGKRQSKTFATHDLARTELRRLEVAADENAALRDKLGTGASTVREAFAAFMARRKPDPGNTARRFERRSRAYQRTYDLHIEPHLGDVRLCDLTPRVLREWLDKLATTRTARPGERNESGRTLGASSIRHVVVTLRQLAKDNDAKIEIPQVNSLRQKRRRSRPRALQSIEDVRALLGACREGWFRVACALACHVGARLGEIASLRWRHIGTDTITIALSWEGPLKARYEDDEDGARVLPLGPELTAELAAWRAVTRGGPDDHVVLVDGVRPLREGYDDMAAKTRSACKRAGLEPLTFHSLRATYATLTADAGLPITKLSALLGHADAATTAIYIRPESSRAAVDPRAILGGTVSAPSVHAGDRDPN